MINKPISKAVFTINSLDKINVLREFLVNEGQTDVQLNIIHDNKRLSFKIKGKKKVDNNLINSLKNKDILTSIN